MLVEIRSKFGNKNILECSFSKSMNSRTPRSSTGKCGQNGMQSGGRALKTFWCPRVPLV